MASWNDGTAKSSLLDFVQRVMTEGRKDFALVPERAGPAESGVLSSTGEKLDNGSFGAHSCSYDMGSLFLANLFLPRLWL
jgi:hypothetical protein